MSSRFPLALAALYAWAFGCFAFVSGFHPVAVLLLPLAALAFWKRESYPMTKLYGGIGIGVALLGAGLLSQTAKESGYLLGTGSLSFAAFAALLLVSFTVLRSTEETRLAIPGLCGFLLVTSSMTVKLAMVAAIGLPGVVLLALAFRERQGLSFSRWLLPPMLVVLVMTLVLAWAAKWSETRLSYFLNLFAVIPASGIRFPPNSSLDSLQRWNATDTVVLRVHGDTAPPYLIGRTFTNFDNRSFWTWKPTKQEIQATGTVPDPYSPDVSLHYFPNDPTAEAQMGAPVTIEFPDGGSGFTFYTPRHFAGLATDLQRIHRYSDGLWQVLARDEFSGFYTVFPYHNGWSPQRPPDPLSPDELKKHLALPPDLTPEVARLAQEVAGAYADPEEKANRINTFFQTKFTYGYDFPFTSPQKALEEFLLQRPPAHCEFFATSAALMLRAQGVPTRYINGFVVQERSFDDEYFIIRLKHAHAWVEVYLPGKGWTTFDPTPPGTLDSPDTKSSSFSGALEWFSNAWRRLLSWFRMSPSDMLDSAKRFLSSRQPSDWLALLGIIAAIWGLRSLLAWRRSRGSRPAKVTPFQAGRHQRLTPLLESLQSAVQPPQWQREAWETSEQWVTRLETSSLGEPALERIRLVLSRYGAARYGAHVSVEELATLEVELGELRREFEGKSLQAREPQAS